jgi:hypothetical protein
MHPARGKDLSWSAKRRVVPAKSDVNIIKLFDILYGRKLVEINDRCKKSPVMHKT